MYMRIIPKPQYFKWNFPSASWTFNPHFLFLYKNNPRTDQVSNLLVLDYTQVFYWLPRKGPK